MASQAAEKLDFALDWQRFTAAITRLFSVSALAAEVRLPHRRYFFRKLFSPAAQGQ
jgi:hypothetical protein